MERLSNRFWACLFKKHQKYLYQKLVNSIRKPVDPIRKPVSPMGQQADRYFYWRLRCPFMNINIKKDYKLPGLSVCRSVGLLVSWSICHIFLRGQEFSLQCTYWRIYFTVFLALYWPPPPVRGGYKTGKNVNKVWSQETLYILYILYQRHFFLSKEFH